MEIEAAADKAIDDMPDDAELKGFLVGHRAEVRMSCLTEYDEEATMRAFQEEAREEGLEVGREEGGDLRLIDLVRKKVGKGKSVDVIADEVEENEETVGAIVKIIMTCEGQECSAEEIYAKWKSGAEPTA